MNNKKGFSLTVLVIAIAVIVIITSTSVITVQNINKDRKISEFMTDLADVKQFIIEHVNTDGTLPAKTEFSGLGEEVDAKDTLLNALKSGDALGQIDVDDVGNYYFVDLAKLGKIHLSDEERGYIFNEGTLNVYVTTPVEYRGVQYYTLTPDLTGKSNPVNKYAPFEVAITGNPVTWSSKAEILVSVTNSAIGVDDEWNFRWLKGDHTADDFKVVSEVNYFTYGDTISLTENGIYTINVESPNHESIVRKIVVTKVDDILPTIVKKDGKLYIDDAETGVRAIRYKIKETNNFAISEEARKEHPECYTSQDERASDTVEELVEKYLWGSENIKGDRIENYLTDYSEYYKLYTTYNEIILNLESTVAEIENAENAIRILNNTYPQFAYNNRPFSNTEKNIVIYVEDAAGNGTVYSAVSRTELTNLQYVTEDKETLTDTRVLINNGEEYTKDRTVSLHMQALHAKYYFASEDENPSGTFNFFNNTKENFEITSTGDGQKTVYVIFEDEAQKRVKVSDTIFLDETEPSKDAPTVTGSITNVNVVCNQTDTNIVDGVETQSGLAGRPKYGLKKESDSSYKWYNRASDFPRLEEGTTYKIVTSVTDKAGNTSISDDTEFKVVTATMIARYGNEDKGFWKVAYKDKITSIEFKKGNATVPTGAIDLGNLATDTAHSVIQAYLQDDGTGNGTYKCTVISPQTIYANDSLRDFFNDFTSVKQFDFTNFDTSRVTLMTNMFNYCKNVTSLDLRTFDTSNVKSMMQMFYGCSALKDLNISSFETSQVTNMQQMFNRCTEISTIDVTSFDTQKVENMYAMFCNDYKLTKIYVSSKFDVSSVTNSEGMFERSTQLVGGNGTTYNSNFVDKTYARIDKAGTPGYFTSK
ncbi:MAG: BspA family leucine-rich repeat surface protein [Clostridia bacterium]|nr:BspA family leucine-rich repeat surface protein [Clostridia bacterium]